MKRQLTSIRKFNDCLTYMNVPLFSHIDRDDFAIVKIEELGIELPFQTPVFRPDHFSIIVVPEGNAIYHIGCEEYELITSHVLVIRPDTFLSSKWISVRKAYCVSFSKCFLSKYSPAGVEQLQKLDSAKGYLLNAPQQMMETMESICQEIYNEALLNTKQKYELITNLIVNLLLLIREEQQTNRRMHAEDKDNPNVISFMESMEDSFSKIATGQATTILRAKDYAKMQNLNESYLSKIVCATTGKTINQWIHEKLICEIRYLLKYTDKPLKDIAQLYGFEDLANFYNYFKRHNHCTPGSFRKEIHVNETFTD